MKKIPINGIRGEGKYLLVDDEDFELVSKYNWSLHICGYAEAHIPGTGKVGKRVLAHRLILNAKKGQLIDHRNFDRLDCQKNNIRFATKAQNSMNRILQKNNTSGYRGVYFAKRENKWLSQIKFEGKHKFLGYFNNKIKAAKKYDSAAKELFGEFAKLNFTI